MYNYRIRKCPIGQDQLDLILPHLHAKGRIGDSGALTITFDDSLPEHRVCESISLLREYFLSIRNNEPLYQLIDTEEIDGRYLDTAQNTPGFRIESFGAFGSGVHETTGGCMELIREFCNENSRRLGSVRLLDIGTGTGILSIFAHYQGIRDITAVDISLRAIISALHNCYINGIAGAIRLKHGTVRDIEGRFELTVANIFLSVISDIFGDIHRKTVPGGTIIISGIKKKEEGELMSIISGYPAIEVSRKMDRDGWICVRMDRRKNI